jgi:hypothetical protein
MNPAADHCPVNRALGFDDIKLRTESEAMKLLKPKSLAAPPPPNEPSAIPIPGAPFG